MQPSGPLADVKLVLFDVDGTLLHTGGAGRRAMEASLREHFGTTGSPAYRYDGKTDAQIVRETMSECGVSGVEIDHRLPRVLQGYMDRLDGELESGESRTTACVGVVDLLDALSARADRVLGLLTGNLAGGAALKLRAAGIDPACFAVGAYGSDHERRDELPAIALERASRAVGVRVTGSRAVVIGDTPSDIACGRGAGVRAIAVATGHYTVGELAAHSPLAVFADLSDTTAVLLVIDDA